MKSVSYFFSVLSPFTYLAGDRLEQIAETHGARVDYRPIDIMGVFAKTGGVPPKDRHESRKSYRLQDLARLARLSGMPINLSPAFWPTDPVPASCAIIQAQEDGSGDLGDLVRNLLRACWAEEQDISQEDVVAGCLAAAGFDANAIGPVGSEAQKRFREYTEDAVQQNVFGSPTYVSGGQVFWGQDRLSHLDAWLGGRLD